MTQCASKKRFIFSKQLADIVLDNNYIPRRIKSNEHLKQYHRYWSSYSQVFCKVLDIYYIKNREYYSVKMQNSLFGELSYPLVKDYIFELIIDYKNLKNTWIINNPKIGSLSGAEIRYWFFIKNIDLDNKYSGFWSYLDYNSKSCISDDKYYYVKIVVDDRGNKKFKISIDKYKK